jgi:hypothetical protein
MSTAQEIFEFTRVILPELVTLGRELYDMFDGNAELALREIKDRRDDIARRRAVVDEALRKKHGSGGSRTP